jgi:hypothetical protein
MRATSCWCPYLALVALAGTGCGRPTPRAPADGDASVATGGSGGAGGTGGGGGVGGAGRGGAGGAGTGGAGSLGCAGAAASSCTRAELDPYNECLFARCEREYSACYGPGARTGNFSGPCGTFVQCTSKCGCSDLACLVGCGAPSAECASCGQVVVTCQGNSGCARPACLREPDAGVPAINFDGGFPGFDGGFPGFDGRFPGLPDGGLGGGTCDDLLKCCQAIADPANKAMCSEQYDTAKLYGDLVCGTVHAAHKQANDCP